LYLFSFTTVRYELRQGKGNVIRRMFAEIDAECCYRKNRQDFEMELYRVMKEYREAGGGKHPETPEHKEHEEDAGT
jgi:hypothetical protein